MIPEPPRKECKNWVQTKCISCEQHWKAAETRKCHRQFTLNGSAQMRIVQRGYWHISSRFQWLHAEAPFSSSSLITVDSSSTVYSSLEIEEADIENEVFIVSDGEVPIQSVGVPSFLNTLVGSSFEEADLGEFEMSTAVLGDASWGPSLGLDTPCFRLEPNDLSASVKWPWKTRINSYIQDNPNHLWYI